MPPAAPSVYRTRNHRLRQRLVLGAAGAGLLLLGYLIGRWQDTPPPTVDLLPLPVVSATSAPLPSPAATTSAPAPRVYPTLQAESASALTGIEPQDTEDQGGGQNVGWIANGDQLRFDDFDFGPVPPARLDVRVATDADGGRMEIRLDRPDQPPIGTLRVTRTGGWQSWRTDEVSLTGAPTGRHTVFLVFVREDGSEFLNVNWLQFGH
ncbi:MAG: carbohydrate-binding protein [Actinoplanes sp.]